MLNKASKQFFSSGQTLIEVLIITVLVATILTAIAGVVAQSLKNTSETKRQVVATDLAQQGIEVFRSKRISLGWDSFQSAMSTTTYCLNSLPATDQAFVDLAEGSCGDETVSGTEFTREAEVESASDAVTVTVHVTWNADEMETISITQTFKDIEN